MAKLSPKLRSVQGGIMHWCPGCEHAHVIYTSKEGREGKPTWGYNGSIDKPTTTPSVLIFVTDDEDEVGNPLPQPIKRTLCHYFLTDGNLVFCGDSKHIYAGQTVPLPDIPDNYGGGE